MCDPQSEESRDQCLRTAVGPLEVWLAQMAFNSQSPFVVPLASRWFMA